MNRRTFIKYTGAAALSFTALGCIVGESDKAAGKELTVYSGRGESLVGPLIEKFQRDTGIKVKVRYGKTSELAAAILEEGKNSPADLYWAQDAGALGYLSRNGRFLKIDDVLLEKVDPRFRSRDRDWLGITGRARTVDYNINLVKKEDLPESIWEFTEPKWGREKIGWAPTNGSFQAFVTAFRVLEGEDRTREWLEGIIANKPQVYPKNTPIVAALGRGEIQVGFVNNYYLHRFQAEDPGFPVAHHYTRGDAGALVNIAGLAMLDTAKDRELAELFIKYMLSEDTQRYFATETYEYPLVEGIDVVGPQKSLSEIETPDIDLNDLWDLEGTVKLLQDVGAL
ncbi:iron ABC transporter substrate-binding protein [Candidatus Pyrohabitans sp.]